MAEFAYREESRTLKVEPITALGERGKVDHYYCPNPACNAWLRVVSGDGFKHPNPFFRALPSHKHIEGCDYKAYYDEESQKNKIYQTNLGLHENDFLIEKLYEIVISKSEEVGIGVEVRKIKDKTDNKRESLISSTERLARYCLAHDVDENLGESTICDFLIDSRTANERYRQFIHVESGNKVFLLYLPLYGMWYDKPSQRVRLFLKENYLDNTNVAYMFDVRFDSSELFWGFINAAYELRETRSKVAILTKLSKQYDNDDYYMCSVVSDRQLWIRRDNSIV